MGKIKNFGLMVLSLLIMAIMAVGCVEDLTRNDARAQSSDWVPMPWNLDFKHTVDNRGSEYETQWITTESNYKLREVCPMLAKVSHKNDRYAVADKYRNVSADYSNAHMTAGDVDIKTSGTSMRREFKYSQRFTFEVEDGNLLYFDWSATRVALQDTIENRMVYLPFDSIVSVKIKSFESLPGDTKYKTRGDDTFVSDSIVRKATFEVERVAIGGNDSDPTVVDMVDMFKVLLLSKNEIADAKEENVSRVVLDETTERCSFDEVFTMKSGEKHVNPHNIILTREFITIPEWEMIVKNTGYTHKELSPLARGTIKTVSDKDSWSVREQTDEFSSTASAEGEKDVVFPYKFRHQGATYQDEYVKVDFPLIALTTAERNTWTEEAKSTRDGYSAKRLKNATATSYLDFDQDVSESMILLKENVHPTSEGWKKDECTETITNDEVIWKLIYVIDYSDGSKDRIPFEFKDTRSLICKSDWNSIEKNTKHSTSGVTVKLTSTEPKSAEQNGATAKWDRITNDLSSVVTLDASKQENKWVSVEPTNVSVTYREKTFTFEKNSIKATNTDNVGAAVKSDGAEVSKYTATLNYVWGNNTKTSNAPGTITVKDVVPTSEDWSKSECTETITENQVVWKLVYIINYSDGTQQKIPFEFSDGRSLTCESNWNSVEKNTKHSTSGVNVTTISTEPKSAEQNGATAKWNRVKSALSSVATLDASKQENKWTSVEPTDVSVTYRNKTFSFNKNSIKASNTDNVGSAVKSGNSEVSKYTATLNYVWGNNTKTSNAPGSITVNAVVPTSEDWSKSECSETVTDNQVVWNLVYIINYSDGTQQRFPFQFSDSRSLNCESNWNSIESNTNHSTSGVNVTTLSTDPRSAEQNGATAKWNRVKSSLSSVATLAGSKQQNKWTSVEPTDVSVTYRNKTYSFSKNSIRATNTDKLGSAVKNGDYEDYKYTANLNYVWSSNTKSSNAPGLIRVKSAPENTFFPPEWGSLLSAKQTLSNSRNHDSYVYVWSLHFEKGVLPVIIPAGDTSPNWHFEYFEYTSNHEYNSAVWQKDKNTWVNAVASDPRNMMLWSRNSVELANKDRDEASSQKWDEGHTVNGKCSVFTSRYNLDVTNGRLTATDTYKNIYMGSWK